DEILYVLRAFLEADALMRESPHPRVELEIATVRAARRPVPQALDDVLRRVDEAQREMRQQAMARSASPAAAPAPQANLLGVEPAASRTEAGRPVAAPPVGAPPPRPGSAASAPAAMPTAAAAPVSAPTPSAAPARSAATAPAAGDAPADADLATAWE